MEATGARAAKHELAGHFDAAFDSYVKAAQTYIFLIRHCPDLATKERLKTLSGKLVERATRIKQAKKDVIRPVKRDRLSIEEQDAVLQRSSTLNHLHLPRWEPKDAQESPVVTDVAQPALSSLQLEHGGEWRSSSGGVQMVAEAVSGRDIVQDNVADCSLVAALIIGAQHHAKFGSRLGISCLYPQTDAGLPRLSKTGRYTARFLVNGTWRLISIDDRLPFSADGQLMSASTRQHDQLWPSLVEKAYLKLMGGYEFRGSNSGVDLYALSGWIPDHVSLRSTYHSERTWSRIFRAFEAGQCVVTLGTAKSHESLTPGLIASHCYAVLDLRERAGRREVELMNPWPASASASSAPSWSADLRSALPDTDFASETFLVEWEHLPSHFEALQINWDPDRFEETTSAHYSLPSAAVATNERRSTQLRLRVENTPALPSEIWLLLCRHLHGKSDADEFIGLSLVKSWKGARQIGGPTRVDTNLTLTDNPFMLYRFNSDAETTFYDLFVSHRGSTVEPRFTLRAFSSIPVKLEDGPPPLPYTASVKSGWTEKTAGGNHTCATFLNNPQYRVTLSTPPGRRTLRGEIAISCNTSKDTPVNVKFVRGKGDRVADFEERDVVAGASTYSYGFESCHADDLQPESYTLVVSSFQPQHVGDFELQIESSLPVSVTPIPSEGAGLFTRSARGSWTSQDGSALGDPRFLLGVSKTTTLKIRLQVPNGPLPISLAVYSTSSEGAPSNIVGTTGPFSEAVCGVITRSLRLSASEAGYVVVPVTSSKDAQAAFQLYVYADQPVTLSAQKD